MHADWPQTVAEFNGLVGALRVSAPETMGAFAQLARAAGKAGALDGKTKELIALAISVAGRCDPCIAYHAKAAEKHGASREEVAETLAMAVYMGAGPAVMYAAKALEAFEQFSVRTAAAAE